MKKEKETCANLATVPQTEKVTTVYDKCLGKMEKALNLDNKIF